MNTIFDDIAIALSSVTSWDDIATGVVCISFCAASASLFLVAFSGAV